MHAIQNARRQAGLEVTDRIELGLSGDRELLAAARAHRDYLAAETLAVSIALDGGGRVDGGVEARIEGRPLRIALSRP